MKSKIEEFEEFAFEIKINRDYYSRARIIEELVNKVNELFKEVKILKPIDIIDAYCQGALSENFGASEQEINKMVDNANTYWNNNFIDNRKEQ
jgi:hypothetical protein